MEESFSVLLFHSVPTSMGEFTVHRVRFFDYTPSAIRAAAFQRRMERLAVARADGAVEIFNLADHCFQEKVGRRQEHLAAGGRRRFVPDAWSCFGVQVVPGRDGRTAEALRWVGRRLFGAGLNGDIVEYDLEKLRPRYTVEAYGGPIWTITSNSPGSLLAVSQ